MVEVLLAGESWVTLQFEIKGQNVLRDSTYEEAAGRFVKTLEATGASVTYQPCHVAATDFPRTRGELDAYDLVILSDVGADTLQITPQVAGGETDVDRCALLESWVADGGALGMVGGYMSFAGKGGQARYGTTPVGKALPVTIGQGDDRVETPAGVTPKNVATPVESLPAEWPTILGYNRFTADPGADVWATVGDDPFLVVGDHGAGGTFAYATDCAPHWAPDAFLDWDHLPTLWGAVIDAVVGDR
ncbi:MULTISPECIES: glutamine amidotransferase [unclassified Haladaptatus]|uniref:glutamine amidotransferase n=1 Tax=unclassified Haladaptatus TaxID=2622732 RepID=UPI0023E833B1|nr:MULTISPECIES: glutamine amidotransferase [unclassified Haladaptatus]